MISKGDHDAMPMGDPSLLIELTEHTMPFGKYKGTILCKLPVSYLEWFQRKGFPRGRLGQQLQTLYEIRLNGLESILRDIEKMAHQKNNH